MATNTKVQSTKWYLNESIRLRIIELLPSYSWDAIAYTVNCEFNTDIHRESIRGQVRNGTIPMPVRNVTVKLKDVVRKMVSPVPSHLDDSPLGLRELICPNCDQKGTLSKSETKITNDGVIIQEYECSACHRHTMTPVVTNDKDVVLGNVKLAKQLQRARDDARIERKSFREHARMENAVGEYGKTLVRILEQHQLSPIKTTKVGLENSHYVALVHLTDLHINQIVDMGDHQYNFEVAAARLRGYAADIKRTIMGWGVKKVVVAVTGDLLNSDRRLDELLTNALNRSRASFIAIELLRSFLLDLATDFHVDVPYVVGNESRMFEKVTGNTVKTLSENYDFVIMEALRVLLNNQPNINILTPDDLSETLIDINGSIVALIHGHQKGIANKNPSLGINKLIKKYAQRGIIIRFVISGHYHNPIIADSFARSASLVGGDEYANNDLQECDRASQNLHLVGQDAIIHSMKIDLQNYQTGGYDYNIDLSHDAGVIEDRHNGTTIMKIVI